MKKYSYVFLFIFCLSENAKADFTAREAYLVSQLVDYCRAHQAYANLFLPLKFKGYEKQAIINSLSNLEHVQKSVLDKAYARDVQESGKDDFIDLIVEECYDKGLEMLVSGEMK